MGLTSLLGVMLWVSIIGVDEIKMGPKQHEIVEINMENKVFLIHFYIVF